MWPARTRDNKQKQTVSAPPFLFAKDPQPAQTCCPCHDRGCTGHGRHRAPLLIRDPRVRCHPLLRRLDRCVGSGDRASNRQLGERGIWGPNAVHPMAKTSEMREDSRWDFEVCHMFGPQVVFSHIVDTCARAVCWAQRASRPKGGKRRTAGKRSHGAGTGQRQGGWARLGGDVMGSRL